MHRLPGRTRAGAVGAIVCAVLAAGPAGAVAKTGSRTVHRAELEHTAKVERGAKIEHTPKQPFGKIAKGPLQIIISVNQQRLHLYSNGEEVAETPVATGVAEHPTPLGVFNIIQKQLYHRSNIYSGAPMPYMERITWSGVALHEGVNLGHPASHGCIRMSHDFAVRLYEVSKLGVEVIIADSELRPHEFADAHLFAHKDPAPVPVLAAASIAPLPAALAQDTPPSDRAGTTDAANNNKAAPDSAGATDPPKDSKAAVETAPTPDAAAPASPAPHQPIAADVAANPVTADLEATPVPPLPPIAPAFLHASKSPISIFISRKTAKIYVRQDFEPLFSAPITIDNPAQPFGTFVFTALQYLPDRSGFVWNVVSLPEREKPKPVSKSTKPKRRGEKAAKDVIEPPRRQSPEETLARIEIPQDAIERISQMIIPGSSLIISDQGLGEETGEGTNFVVVTH